jgi:peptide/nickel transport system substrate-binding protein
VDREFVVSQIYNGFAAPMVCFLSSYDPDYVTVFDIIAKYDFKYDLATAMSIIDKTMTEAGAVMVEGKWHYNNNPVVIRFAIRTEDERRDIGDSVASSLELAGFTVDRMYMTFGEAIPLVYGTDPAEHQWDLYTEGWGKSGLDRYDQTTINQYGAPWFGWIPGFQEEGWWQYENATIDEIGQRIYLGQYGSREERDQLYREGTEIVIQESTRVWLATRLDVMPARAGVRGLTEDMGTGLRSPYNPREVNVAGESTVYVGHLHVHTDGSAWNPIAGHDDVYSVDQWNAVSDPFTYQHPFTGMPIPKRWGYEVFTAGPEGTMAVPTDAVLWNAVDDVWEAVGSDVTATSRVTFDVSTYVGANWHNGQPITWGDVLWAIARNWEAAYDPLITTIETGSVGPITAVIEPFKGFKIVDNTLEVYLDFWHFDENYIASYADIVGQQPDSTHTTGHYPWEVMIAMDKVVMEDQVAMYSETASDTFGVPWFSVNLEGHASWVDDALDELVWADIESYFNVLGTMYATEAELAQRIGADHAWYLEHRHMVISDGPYYLNQFDAAANFAEMKAYRDSTYPFEEGDWYFGRPTPPEIVDVGIPTVVPGGSATFIVQLEGLPTLGVTYLIRDPITAQILDTGSAESVTSTRFSVTLDTDFTEMLEPGLYELIVVAFSDQVALVAQSTRFFDVFNILPLTDAFEQATAQQTAVFQSSTEELADVFEAANQVLAQTFESATVTLGGAVQDVDDSLQELGTSLTSQYASSTQNLSNSINSLIDTMNTQMILLAVVIVISIIVLIVLLVKK